MGTPNSSRCRQNEELENVLRHLIGQASQITPAEDMLVGVGAQLVFMNAGVCHMSLKSDIDSRNTELVSALSMLRAAQAEESPHVQALLEQAQTLINQAVLLRTATPGRH